MFFCCVFYIFFLKYIYIVLLYLILYLKRIVVLRSSRAVWIQLETCWVCLSCVTVEKCTPGEVLKRQMQTFFKKCNYVSKNFL